MRIFIFKIFAKIAFFEDLTEILASKIGVYQLFYYFCAKIRRL